MIRANEGDIVEIEFHNDLDCQASMHQYGLPYEVNESDGLAVGYNKDTTVAPDDSITYRWYADNQGTHFFGDGASPAMLSDPEQEFDDNNLQSRGLFGALSVESPEATWTDPKTGKKLKSGVKADIHEPDGVSHREFVVCYHDAIDIVNADGSEPVWPGTDTPQSVHGINYRAATTSARLGGQQEEEEEPTFYSSWVHGDPGGGDLVFPCYMGDPVKMSVVGAQHEENHVHHLHGHRWKNIPGESESDTIDSKTIGPTASFEARLTIAHGPGSISPDIESEEAFETGAGANEHTGDFLFHCHMFPHYGEGMNGMMRVFDKERKELQLLENSDPPLDADSEIEGFPDFIPAEDGELPPKPPESEPNGREPEEYEEAALTRQGEIVPGGPYQDPCDPEGFDPEVLGETREYTIVALAADVVYNDAGDHDPEGKVYVLEEDAEAVRNGKMDPEPLVIRANVGDCVKVTLKNELELSKSVHPHFVNFDPLGSDAANVGYNYDQGTDPGEEMQYRWFANEEGMIFFHDHITGIPESQNGLFAAIIVEPEDSTWHDPHTGEEIESGSQAIIDPGDGDSFREFALLYHDFAPLKDCNGRFINQEIEHNQNAGSGAINYRTAPYFRRNDDDPAYLHSSRLHGDPPTPTLEAYTGDPVRLRLLQGPYEEQHNFTIHGIRGQPDGLRRAETTSQIIGPSEAFSFELTTQDTLIDPLHEQENPDGLPIWDHIYGSDMMQDLWEGMWGIFRLFGAEVDHLQPLPDRNTPDETISTEELRKMGHPAPFSNWAKRGHKDKLLYDKGDDRRFVPDKDERQNDNIGKRPPEAENPGDPCPEGTPTQTYDITAIRTEIEYNDYGDHDPCGVVYVLDDEVEAVRNGKKNPEPLTIRANAGDCIEINLTNALGDLNGDHAHPTFDIEPDAKWKRSQRISLTPQNLLFDDQGSAGMAAGFNFDSTVAPGETRTYRWYADPAPIPDPGAEGEETNGPEARSIGTGVVSDFADVRSNRHHGAFGNLIVEPEGAEWLDPETGDRVQNGTQAIITGHDGDDFREIALMFTDGMYIVNDDGECPIPRVGLADEEGVPVEEIADEPCNQITEQEDQGFQGINYRSEPFRHRFANDDRQHKVYSSKVHGDPNTPVFRAYTDDPITMRVSQPADRANGITFHCAGHQWRRNNVPEAPLVGTQDDISTGTARDLVLADNAGGAVNDAGDYVYQERKTKFYLEGGLWGLMRVRDASEEFDQPVLPLPDRSEMD
ncbi:multicopper oxidase domain-containing protein [Saliphagus infecundisoli]|uniref:Multicopper oxidase domain-containing protein n=1 Tax=Saliphagus infecundisoli TaxID=1849069 RepID=A0ABD5QMM7_9EURY|nr:multicopper oxidase domain-containing protein [Saliphagus infecundisoli]